MAQAVFAAVNMENLSPKTPPEPQPAAAPTVPPGNVELEQKVAELQVALEHRERQIHAMRRASEALFQQHSVDALVRQTLNVALEVLDAEAGSLQLHDPDTDTLVFRYMVGPSAESLTGHAMPVSQGINGQVFRTGVPDLAGHVSERKDFNPAIDERSGFHTESMMTVPVQRLGGAPIGVMQILNARGPGFDHSDLEVLQVLCGQAASAIETARLAQQARKAEIVSIIGDISHDIKNMLTPIQSGLWTLQPMLDDLFADVDKVVLQSHGRAAGVALSNAATVVRETYPWIFSAALESCEQVQTRTRDIADAVKGELAAPLFEEGALNDVVNEVARPLFLLAEKTNVHLHLEIDHNLPRIKFDRKQIYNALYNLVSNAIPATPSGGSVTIRTCGPQHDARTMLIPGGETLLLEVQDTGCGIPEPVRLRLFTDEAISTKPGGTGLGTRIVADIVRRHNGTITVESELGKGSTFSIRLPLHHKE